MKNNQGYKLLIVDDEPEITELLAYNFSKRGFEVQTAHNGFSGFNSLKTFEPDIIILDIMMPIVNGISMCQEIKQHEKYKDIPVYFLSATNNQELINSALNSGGEQFISKPIQISMLINLIINKSIRDQKIHRQKNKTDFIDSLIEPDNS